MTVGAQGAERGGAATNVLVVGIGLLFIVGLLLLAQVSRSVTLNRSATGFDGLPRWLAENDVASRSFYGRASLDPDVVGLRILPLHDVDLMRSASDTNDDEAVMAETDRDIRDFVVLRKMSNLPTLLVMPKWRAGVREAGAIHPELLISDESADRIASQIAVRGVDGTRADIGRLVRDTDAPDVTADLPSGGRYRLHYPQTLRDSPCEPLIGTTEAMLLGECAMEGGDPFWVLADPDLLNNHGLSRGDNAGAALDWLPELAGNGEIAVDTTTAIWWQRPGAAPQRSWSELGRFFAYPFSVIWGSFAFLAALVLWRAWRRYGPADARSDEEGGPRAARLLAMDTKARLLRLAGRDDALVDTYVEERLETLANAILGPQRARGPDDRDRLMAAIARRSPTLAEEFAPFREAGPGGSAAPDTLLRHVARLDDLIERTMDEFGRLGRAR